MHLLIGTRGNKESVELFIKELSSKYMPLSFTNKKNGKVVQVAQPIHVRPLQLWEIIFPKEQRDVVLTTLFPNKVTCSDYKPFRTLRKLFFKLMPFCHLKKIPKDWNTKNKFYVEHKDVGIMGICMKDDKTQGFKRSPEAMKSIGLDPKGDWEFEAL